MRTLLPFVIPSSSKWFATAPIAPYRSTYVAVQVRNPLDQRTASRRPGRRINGRNSCRVLMFLRNDRLRYFGGRMLTKKVRFPFILALVLALSISVHADSRTQLKPGWNLFSP